MIRLIALLGRKHRACRLHRAPPAAVAPPPRRRPRQRRAAPPPAPKPELGTFGFDTAGMDTSVLPGDNFYQYANGTWAKNTPIPADKSNYGMFTKLDDLSQRAHPRDHRGSGQGSGSRIGDRLSSFLDRPRSRPRAWRRSSHGSTRSRRSAPRPAMPQLVCQGRRASASAAPFGVFVGQDDKNPDRYITELRPGRPRHARPRLLSVDRCQAGRDPRQISRASDQHADPGRRGECRRARQGDPRFRNARSPRSTGPGSTAATRPRPITR